MVKKIFSLINTVLLCFLITGCLSKGENSQKSQYEKLAIPVAKTFVDEKYNMDAEVIDSNADVYRATSSKSLTGKVHVTLEYNGKRFEVITDGGNNPKAISDNYQSDKIIKDYIQQVSNFFEKEPYKYIIDTQYNYDYYDGNNLSSFYPEAYRIFYIGDIDFSNSDFENSKLFALPTNYGKYGMILNYKSEKDFTNSFSDKGQDSFFGDDAVLKNSIYLKEAISISDDVKYFDFSKLSQDDALAFTYDNEVIPYTMEDYKYLDFDTSPKNSSNESCKDKEILNGYKLLNVHDNVNLFIKLDKIPNYNTYLDESKDVNIYSFCQKNNEIVWDNYSKIKVVGNYLYGKIHHNQGNCDELYIVIGENVCKQY